MQFLFKKVVLFFAGLGVSGVSSNALAVEDQNSQNASKTFSLAEFSHLDVGGAFEVSVAMGSPQKIEVFAPQEMLERLSVHVSGNALKVGYKSSWRFWNLWQPQGQRHRLVITVPQLDTLKTSGSVAAKVAGLTGKPFSVRTQGSSVVELDGEIADFQVKVSGSGSVRAMALAAQYVDVKISGSGKVTVAGSSENVRFQVSGSGEFEAEELSAKNVEVSLTGSGRAFVNASSTLQGSITGSGRIRYVGSPRSLSVKTSGSGKIEQM